MLSRVGVFYSSEVELGGLCSSYAAVRDPSPGSIRAGVFYSSEVDLGGLCSYYSVVRDPSPG